MITHDIIFGKHVLESLSVGMYSDPLTIYREYIQNATDALDKAISIGIISKENAEININVNKTNRLISIRDNGTGVASELAYNTLLDVANSQKNYRETRGFRGIGRLGGLGCSQKLIFITSSLGEPIKTIVCWNCDELLRMLNLDNKEVNTALEVMQKVTSVTQESEDINAHYFEVRLQNVYPEYDDLLSTEGVEYYLATVAPVPFDGQKFAYSHKISEKFRELNKPIEEYHIFLNDRKKPIYKKYKTQVDTGHQQRSKKKDYVNDVEFFTEYDEQGELIYFGWYGITNFFGSIADKYMQGVRIRKGNILIGNERTFSKFFVAEGERANSWFMGEVYVYDPGIIPNAKRDDFERNQAYEKLADSLSKKADDLNRRYRRLMSDYHSAVKNLGDLVEQLNKIEREVDQSGITSDTRKEKLLEQKEEIEKRLELKGKELEKIIQKEKLEDQYKEKGIQALDDATKAKQKIVEVENKIINADYATKNDLPSSFSREERKLYQRIIAIIDEFFAEDKSKAEELRKKICEELNNGNKKK